jgi:hypothetical protein
MERPKGVIGQWYTLTSKAVGRNSKIYSKGFTWLCNQVDYLEEPIPPCGYMLGKNETYRLATAKEISKAIAKAKGELTQYQQAVKDHIAEAPEELREYVWDRLKDVDAKNVDEMRWEKGRNPIISCGFEWDESKEGEEFWDRVAYKEWNYAIQTDFWKQHTGEKEKPTELLNFEKPQRDNINPEHYKQLPKETIDAMVFIWGKEAVALHCQMSAFKYRMRLGHKEGQELSDEIGKIKWYENKARKLRE